MAKRPLILVLLMAVCTAAPAAPDDALDQFIAQQNSEPGLLASHLQQVRDSFAGTASAVTEKASELVLTALSFLGVPYRRGGENVSTGFDCSGLVRAIYEQTAGLVLPRRSDEQAAATRAIDLSELEPGDLVFFNTMRRAFSHVGIYMGDGKFIHAPRTGAVVRVENLGGTYWKARFNGARRVIDLGGNEQG